MTVRLKQRRWSDCSHWLAVSLMVLLIISPTVAEDDGHPHFELPGMLGTFNNGPGQKVVTFPIDRLIATPGGFIVPGGAPAGSPLTISQPGPVTIFDPGNFRTIRQIQTEYRLGLGTPSGTAVGAIAAPATFTTVPTLTEINAAFAATPPPYGNASAYDIVSVVAPPPAYQTAFDATFDVANATPGTTVFNPTDSGILRTNGTDITPPFTDPLAAGQSLDAFYAYDYVTSLAVPTPSGDGFIGRGLVSHNNSVLPRDRVYFDYALLNNTLPGSGPGNLHRFAFGLEKIIVENLSFEVRFPFAATLSDRIDTLGGIASDSAEFGNAMFIVKRVFAQSDAAVLSGGIAITAPTASDIEAVTPEGTPVLRFRNHASHLKPFLAGALIPDEHWFVSGFLEWDLPAGTDPVFLNPDGGGLRKVGNLRDSSHLFFDLQAGYWMNGPESGWFHRWAPLVELHADYGLGDSSTVTGTNYRIIDISDNRKAINMLFGAILDFEHGRSLTLGAGTGVGGDGSQSDGEFRAVLNWPFVFH